MAYRQYRGDRMRSPLHDHEKDKDGNIIKHKIDPDAPGTPGEPGYEPPVRYEDLDDKGKAIWDAHRAKKKNKKKE